MELYNFQKEAIAAILDDKHIVVSQTGSGKGAMAVVWAKSVCDRTNKKQVLIVTTASKANMKPNDRLGLIPTGGNCRSGWLSLMRSQKQAQA